MIVQNKILILFLLLLSVGCVATDALLKQRIEKYYTDQNPKIMWELSDDDFKKKMNEKEYIEYFAEHNYLKELKDVIFSIEKVSTEGNKARVKMRIKAKTITNNTKINETLYDYWIFEHDNWYMHDPSRTN